MNPDGYLGATQLPGQANKRDRPAGYPSGALQPPSGGATSRPVPANGARQDQQTSVSISRREAAGFRRREGVPLRSARAPFTSQATS